MTRKHGKEEIRENMFTWKSSKSISKVRMAREIQIGNQSTIVIETNTKLVRNENISYAIFTSEEFRTMIRTRGKKPNYFKS
jgi:hypothetical protein